MAKPIDYKEEYKKRHASPKAIADRAQRNAARLKMEKKLGKAAVQGKEVHHKLSPGKGGTNSDGNLSLMSRNRNRTLANKNR